MTAHPYHQQKGTRMKLTRWNGQHWYQETMAHFLLTWIFWPGGWLAHRNSTHFTLKQRLHPRLWTPISFLGHRLTFFRWGCQLRIRGGYLVYSTCRRRRQVYWSRNGTPDDATVWLLNPPDLTDHTP